MGTPFTEIYGYFMVVVEDYEINELADTDEEEFYNFLKGFLITGIPEFDTCTSLDYTIEEETINGEIVNRYYFVELLSSLEIKILSKIAVSQYFKRKVQDVLAYEDIMGQREFKRQSASMNFKVKHNWYNDLISDYLGDIKNYRFSDSQLSSLPFFGEYL